MEGIIVVLIICAFILFRLESARKHRDKFDQNQWENKIKYQSERQEKYFIWKAQQPGGIDAAYGTSEEQRQRIEQDMRENGF